MRIRIAGRIVDGEPRLPSRTAGKRLILDGKGREHMILDSGLTGSIAISEEWANRVGDGFFERLGARIVMDCRGGRVKVSGQIS